ncbi:MAG: aspartate-semialdehyde dehydrogenase [Myxococcota bacterium]|jgi:aspartate-semialdehyde dehydrogenase
MTTLRVGLVGATGALGKEVLHVLDRAPWRPAIVVPFASRGTQTPYVTYGSESVAVDDVSAGAIGGLDIVILAVPRDVALVVGAMALEEGVPVVDCSGAMSDDGAPLVVPWVNPEALKSDDPIDVVSVPSSGASLLGAVMGPLVRAGLVRTFDATLLMPASHWGRAGVDELSAQVVALFNSGTPPRKVFESGLAFDVLPVVGELTQSGRTVVEDRIIVETAELLGLRQAPGIDLLGIPVFSGLMASIRVDLAKQADLGLVTRILVDGGVRLSEDIRSLPRPRRLEGRPFPDVGRLRLTGERLTFMAGFDNLRSTATAAVATAGALLQQRGLELKRSTPDTDEDDA